MYLTLEIRITEVRFKNYRTRTNSVNFRAFCSMVVGGNLYNLTRSQTGV